MSKIGWRIKNGRWESYIKLSVVDKLYLKLEKEFGVKIVKESFLSLRPSIHEKASGMLSWECKIKDSSRSICGWQSATSVVKAKKLQLEYWDTTFDVVSYKEEKQK